MADTFLIYNTISITQSRKKEDRNKIKAEDYIVISFTI